jgi:trimethylamine--corrinoid protein Co-methyltransferase
MMYLIIYRIFKLKGDDFLAKFTFDNQPKLTYLDEAQVKLLHTKALEILSRTGVYFQLEEALKILEEKGCEVDYATGIAKFKPEFIEECVRSVPETFQLYDRDGNPALVVGGDNFAFDPGSSGLHFLESDNLTAHENTADDLRKVYLLTDALPGFGLQSTALSPSDVPAEICDVYRVYLYLKNSTKPIITGAFGFDGVENIAAVGAAVAGGLDTLREKPFLIYDVCPVTPLEWNDVKSQNLIDLARLGLPVETISCPIFGTASPVTLAGSLLVYLAETLSGIALVQSVNPGNPMVFGGAPMTFDMRSFTASLNSVESSIVAGCYAQIGRWYGIPVHCYAGLADSKIVDAQAGLETGISGLAAVLGGVNLISGPGMLDFVNTFSLEKLVIDNEIVAMAKRIFRGIDISEETMAVDMICELGHGSDYLSQRHTMKWFKKELYIPPTTIDKLNRDKWEKGGKTDIFDRAKLEVERILENHRPVPLGGEREAKLDDAFRKIMSMKNVSKLPFAPGE